MNAPAAHGFHRISTDDLKRLLRALHRGVFASPLSRSRLVETGFGNIEGHLNAVVGKDVSAAVAAIVAVMQERSAWEHRTRPRDDQA